MCIRRVDENVKRGAWFGALLASLLGLTLITANSTAGTRRRDRGPS